MIKKLNNDGALALSLVIMGMEPNEVFSWNKERDELDYKFPADSKASQIIRDNRRRLSIYNNCGRMRGL